VELKMWKIINQESEKLYLNCINKNLIVGSAESCTGGMISSAIVHINGSSQIFKSSVIVYSNDMKSKLLNISSDLINKNGAVSEIVAFNMAKNLLKILKVNLSIAVTGIAGPTGGTIDKPVGLVWIGIGRKEKIITKKHQFTGNRLEIRQKTTYESLKLANKVILEI
jgi:competence/damage-inducible protein CinA C-terminal domain